MQSLPHDIIGTIIVTIQKNVIVLLYDGKEAAQAGVNASKPENCTLRSEALIPIDELPNARKVTRSLGRRFTRSVAKTYDDNLIIVDHSVNDADFTLWCEVLGETPFWRLYRYRIGATADYNTRGVDSEIERVCVVCGKWIIRA